MNIKSILAPILLLVGSSHGMFSFTNEISNDSKKIVKLNSVLVNSLIVEKRLKTSLPDSSILDIQLGQLSNILLTTPEGQERLAQVFAPGIKSELRKTTDIILLSASSKDACVGIFKYLTPTKSDFEGTSIFDAIKDRTIRQIFTQLANLQMITIPVDKGDLFLHGDNDAIKAFVLIQKALQSPLPNNVMSDNEPKICLHASLDIINTLQSVPEQVRQDFFTHCPVYLFTRDDRLLARVIAGQIAIHSSEIGTFFRLFGMYCSIAANNTKDKSIYLDALYCLPAVYMWVSLLSIGPKYRLISLAKEDGSYRFSSWRYTALPIHHI